MDERLAVFRQRFLDRAVTDAAGFREALAAGEWDSIRRRAHSIAGNAGLFGFAEIGEEASALEGAIDESEGEDGLRRRTCALIANLDALPSA